MVLVEGQKGQFFKQEWNLLRNSNRSYKPENILRLQETLGRVGLPAFGFGKVRRGRSSKEEGDACAQPLTRRLIAGDFLA